VLDDIVTFLRQPAVAAVEWILVGLVVWRALPRRYRIVGLAAAGAVVGLGIQPVLALFPVSIWSALLQTALLFGALCGFVAPFVVAVDRFLRLRLEKLTSGGHPVVAYGVAAGTGLAACLVSFGALWWVNDVRSEVQGSYELAILGGVATACIALIRADRNVEDASRLFAASAATQARSEDASTDT
jgi:hypothetical protein